MTRMVQCIKIGQQLPGLEEAPFPGELGDKIFEHISETAWQMWLDHQVNLINHNGLVLANPEHRKFLMEQLQAFFFGEGVENIEGWTPPQ